MDRDVLESCDQKTKSIFRTVENHFEFIDEIFQNTKIKFEKYLV